MAVYLDPNELLDELKRAKDLGYCTDELGKMFLLMTEKYIMHPWWNRYTYKDDMCGLALANMVAAVTKFDPEKSKFAFAYFTTIMKYSFLHIKRYEKKHRDIRDVMLVEHGLEPSHTWLEEQMLRDAEALAEARAKKKTDELESVFTF